MRPKVATLGKMRALGVDGPMQVYVNCMNLGSMRPAGSVPKVRGCIAPKVREVHACPFGTADDALDEHVRSLGETRAAAPRVVVGDRFVREDTTFTQSAAAEAMRWGRALASRNRRYGRELRPPFKTLVGAGGDDGGRPLPYTNATLEASYARTKDIYYGNVETAAARRNPITHVLHDRAGNVIDSMPFEDAPAAVGVNLPSTAERAKADLDRARRWRMAYRDAQRKEVAHVVDGNLAPFPFRPPKGPQIVARPEDNANGRPSLAPVPVPVLFPTVGPGPGMPPSLRV